MALLDNISIPIVGTPLLADSLQKNGIMSVITAALGGVEQTPAQAVSNITASTAAQAPVMFAIQESIKWGFYKNIKGKCMTIFGIDIEM